MEKQAIIAVAFMGAVTSNVAEAKDRRARAHTVELATCPYSGQPPALSFVGDNITVAGIRFNLSQAEHASQFQQLLSVCNCSDATQPYERWRQARTMAAEKGGEAVLFALNASTDGLLADSDNEKQAIAEDAVEKATDFATQLAPLTRDVVATRKAFKATLEACEGP